MSSKTRVARKEPKAITGTHRPAVAAALVRPRPSLADEVRDRIIGDYLTGEQALDAGERLPSELGLSRRYGVSRVTLRAALRSLQEAGFIAIRHGAGATVRPRTDFLFSGLDRLCSIETLARESGLTVGSEDVSFDRVDADERLAEELEIEKGAPVAVIRRVKTYGGDRVAYMVACVPEDVCSLESLRDRFAGSVLDILLNDPIFAVEYSDLELEAVALPAGVAPYLHVDAGTPSLRMEEVMRSANGRAVEWAEAWFLPNHFRFTLRRRKSYLPQA